MGHEALLRRPAGSHWESPAALFAEAERRGERAILESEARRLALAQLGDLPDNQDLFINVDPIVFQSTPPIIPRTTERVILEVTETRSILTRTAPSWITLRGGEPMDTGLPLTIMARDTCD